MVLLTDAVSRSTITLLVRVSDRPMRQQRALEPGLRSLFAPSRQEREKEELINRVRAKERLSQVPLSPAPSFYAYRPLLLFSVNPEPFVLENSACTRGACVNPRLLTAPPWRRGGSRWWRRRWQTWSRSRSRRPTSARKTRRRFVFVFGARCCRDLVVGTHLR
jgi:hypothetical protein